MAEYTQILDNIYSTLQSIDANLDAISSGTQYVDSIFVSHNAIKDAIDSLALDLQTAGSANVATDYTTSLDTLCKFMAYTDLLLIILIIFVVLGVGMMAGYTVTRWLKQNK